MVWILIGLSASRTESTTPWFQLWSLYTNRLPTGRRLDMTWTCMIVSRFKVPLISRVSGRDGLQRSILKLLHLVVFHRGEDNNSGILGQYLRIDGLLGISNNVYSIDSGSNWSPDRSWSQRIQQFETPWVRVDNKIPFTVIENERFVV